MSALLKKTAGPARGQSGEKGAWGAKRGGKLAKGQEGVTPAAGGWC